MFAFDYLYSSTQEIMVNITTRYRIRLRRLCSCESRHYTLQTRRWCWIENQLAATRLGSCVCPRTDEHSTCSSRQRVTQNPIYHLDLQNPSENENRSRQFDFLCFTSENWSLIKSRLAQSLKYPSYMYFMYLRWLGRTPVIYNVTTRKTRS
jgi:hypothetical protein